LTFCVGPADTKGQTTLISSLSAVETPQQPSKVVQEASHSQSSAEESDFAVDKPSKKLEKGNPSDKAPMSTVGVPNETAEQTTMPESSDDDDMYFEENDQLIFDTKIGKLIRPLPSSSQKSSSLPQLEEGQSEEEDGYQPTIVDKKPPSKLDSR
jgi:hypothetical protein